jgi:hypothetical protein
MRIFLGTATTRLLRCVCLLVTVVAASVGGAAVASAQTFGFGFSGGAQGSHTGVGSFVGTGGVAGVPPQCGFGTTSEVQNQILTAANGDTVNEAMTGTNCQRSDGSYIFNATYTISGGTGRFAGATGSGTLVSIADFLNGLSNPGTYSFSQRGTITLNLGNSPEQPEPFKEHGSGTITVG